MSSWANFLPELVALTLSAMIASGITIYVTERFRLKRAAREREERALDREREMERRSSNEKRERRLRLLGTLMATREQGLNPAHVQALNAINLEFDGPDPQSQAVVRAWKEYAEHLNRGGDPTTETWGIKKADLLVSLLSAMGKSLGYDLDKTDIRTTAYFPRGHGETEWDLLRIRRALVELLEQRKGLPVVTYSPASTHSPAEAPTAPPEGIRR